MGKILNSIREAVNRGVNWGYISYKATCEGERRRRRRRNHAKASEKWTDERIYDGLEDKRQREPEPEGGS